MQLVENKSEFATYHPMINFIYFVVVFVFTMLFMHPVCLSISYFCAFSYSLYLRKKKALIFNLLFLLPGMIMAAVINPAFNHEGITILMYLSNGNPLTLESITYGIAASAMLATIVLWFSCFNVVITSDKIIYLFGKIIPSLSLIISMTLRFIPMFKAQIKVISNGQKAIGRDVSEGGIFKRMICGIRILSIMITWVFENAIETADSMKARGYGLPNRTAFSNYSFDKRDRKMAAFIFVDLVYILIGIFNNQMYYRYFPSMKGVGASFYSISVFVAYFIFCITPIVVELMEDRKWKLLRLKV